MKLKFRIAVAMGAVVAFYGAIAGSVAVSPSSYAALPDGAFSPFGEPSTASPTVVLQILPPVPTATVQPTEPPPTLTPATPDPTKRATPQPTRKPLPPPAPKLRKIAGVATWYDDGPGLYAAAGPALRRAIGPKWRGTIVTVCSAICVDGVILSDWCACGPRRGRPTVLDLSLFTFARIGQPAAGVIDVVVKW